MSVTSRRPLLARFALPLLCAAAFTTLIPDARAVSATAGLTGRTNKSGGAGCSGGGCHGDQAQDGATMSVVISGPSYLAPGVTGSYSVTATKATLGAGARMGVNIASTEGGTSLSESVANLVVVSGEIVHSAPTGTINTTAANGSAAYGFSYTMPAAASLGSAHTLYAVSRLGFSGGWKHAANFGVTAATAPGAPTIGAATAGNTQASISFGAPSSNGGVAISNYTATCSAAGQITRSNTGTVSPIVVASLTNAVTYSCSVTATSPAGTSAASGAANATPQLPGVAPQITSAAATTFTVGTAGSFTVTRTGTPTPTLALSGSLPNGVTFSTGSGVLSGTPAAGSAGTWPVTISATNATAPDATQNFTLTVVRQNQTISFAGPAGQAFAANPVALVASASSSLSVSFASSTPAVCGVSGSSATLFTAGTCTITASQSGNGTYNAAADVTRSFTLSPVAPGAPAIGTATPGNGQATLGFFAPTFNGGTPVTGYTVTCNPGARTGSGSTSPITVSGMTNGTPYNCSVMATNAVGPGPASTTVAVTPTSAPVAPIITSANSLTLALGATASLAVTANGTPNPTFSISGTLPAGISFVPVAGSSNPATATLGGTPAFGSAGTYPLTITASNGTLPNATQQFTLTVQKLNQTINAVAPPSPQFFAGGAVPLSAAASSLLPVAFSSDSPFICSVAGSSAIMQSAGTCSISVNQAGNSNYNAAPTVGFSFNFQASSQTISFPTQAVTTRAFVNGGTFAISPLATSSAGLPVVYSAAGSCTVSGTTVTMANFPGTCQITASQPGDSRVLPATQVSQFVQINPGPPGAPTISSFTASSGFATFNLTAPASDGGSQIDSVAVTCTPGPISQSQSVPFFGTLPQISLFGFGDGTPYSCTATATNANGESIASAPVTFTNGSTGNGQSLFQNNCFNCHFNFTPNGTMLNAAGTTGTVLAYARSNVFQMSIDFQLGQLSASDLAAIEAYIKAQLPPIAPSTMQDTDVFIDVGSHITLDTVSFKQVEVVDPPANGTLSAFSGTGVTYTPNPGFSGIDSFSYRGVRGDVQPPLLGDARTVTITVVGASYFLSVSNTSGGFTGNTVTGSGIDCGFDCSQSYNSGTVVTLTPQPAFGYIFTGWGGDCSGSGTCSVTMSANRNVTASFETGYTVTPSAGANGSISPAIPQGVTAGATRSFTISANAGYSASVGGSCGGVLNGNVFTTFSVFFDCTVTATFLRDPVTFNIVFEPRQVSPSNNSLAFGTGTINVNTDAKTISYSLALNGLSGAITDMFVQGPAVRGNVGPARQNLNANPTFGTFSYSPADEADILAGLWYIRVATAAYPSGEVRAQIDALGATPRYVVTVVKAGTGSGTVTGNVGGINCGLVCTANIAQGVFVLLTPTPDAGSVFSGWSFGCGSSGNCALVASADTTITATFSPIPPNYTVTPSAGPGGSISPATPQTVAGGNQTTFTVTPNPGFYANVGGTCFGTYSPPIFVTVAITGNCTIEVTFVQFATVPDAPTIGAASAADGQLTIAFTAPGFDGGSAITSYQATCNPGAKTGSATASPVTVTGLTNNTLYTCSVAAINSLGTGAASGPVSATPQPNLAILSVTSSRMHGGLGPFPITLDTSKAIGEAVTVEPRAIGSGHRIVFTFNNPIAATGSVTLVNTPGPAGSATAAIDGNTVVVTLTGITDNSRATVTLTGVNNTLNTSVSLGFLVGDVNGLRSVTASDLSAIKASIAGSRPVTAQNFRHDVNTSGTISGSDLSAARVRAGQILR